jgi:sulfur carrier protein
MKITLNGEPRDVASGMTVHKLILDVGRKPAATVVECNGDIVDRDAYTSVSLNEGDVIELVQFVGGG